MGEIVSVQLATPHQFRWQGRDVPTGIYKLPTSAEVGLEAAGIAGDFQADHTVHGGPTKAVYAYPAEHYLFWRDEYPGMDLPYGMFGENLTTAGLSESDLWIGDEYRAGTALLRVVQPRQPCFKLGLKFGHQRVIRRFLESGRSGFYLAVAEPGRLRAGNKMILEQRGPEPVSIADLVAIAQKSAARDRLERVVQAQAVLPSWRERARQLLAER